MTTDRSRTPIHRGVDEALFEAWRTGNASARSEAWGRLFATVESWAVPFCRPFAPDQDAARDWAADAINQAYAEVGEKIRHPAFYWDGEPQFAGMFANLVKRRCIDRQRREQREAAARERVALLECAPDSAGAPRGSTPGHEADVLAIARTRIAIDVIVCRLAWRRELCGGRTALVAVIDAELDYLRECCVRAVAGVDTATMSLDELIPLLDRDEVHASSDEMSTFVMKRLNIKRQTLDDRQREIRKLVAGATADEPDRSPTLGAL